MDELKRVQTVYRGRIESNFADRYSLMRPGELYMQQRRERALLHMLRRAGLKSVKGCRVLEIGCGRGDRIADFQRWGARPQDLYGLELLPDFAVDARKNNPAYSIVRASAHQLPFPDSSFDIVAQFTVFTSVLDEGMRQHIAQEMVRVLRPGGMVVWYDFRVPNPWNTAVRPVASREIRELFPGLQMTIRSLTLIPPVARRLAKFSFAACAALELLPLLRTHYLALLRKR
jgi:ubiquinone/menaquinone biosynthesis C-methylase UbiE